MSLKIEVYYVFVPTAALNSICCETGFGELDNEVFIDGAINAPRHTEADIAGAFWELFKRQWLSGYADDPDKQVLAAKGLALGFAGCWSMFVVEGSATIDALFKDLKDIKEDQKSS